MFTPIKSILCSVVLLVLSVHAVEAQKFSVQGRIRNYATAKYVTDTVWVTTMTVDSTVVDKRAYAHFSAHMWDFARVDTAGTYILKFSAKGYVDTYLTRKFAFRAHRNEDINIGDVLLQKIPKSSIQLGEATVKATKLMMVMRGTRSSTMPTRSSWPRDRCSTSSSPCCPAWS